MDKNEYSAEFEVCHNWNGDTLESYTALVYRLGSRKDKEILEHFSTDFSELREFLDAKRSGRPLVHVVHCIDCKHGEPTEDLDGAKKIRCGRCGLCIFDNNLRDPSWFCGDGEEKKQ